LPGLYTRHPGKNQIRPVHGRIPFHYVHYIAGEEYIEAAAGCGSGNNTNFSMVMRNLARHGGDIHRFRFLGDIYRNAIESGIRGLNRKELDEWRRLFKSKLRSEQDQKQFANLNNKKHKLYLETLAFLEKYIFKPCEELKCPVSLTAGNHDEELYNSGGEFPYIAFGKKSLEEAEMRAYALAHFLSEELPNDTRNTNDVNRHRVRLNKTDSASDEVEKFAFHNPYYCEHIVLQDGTTIDIFTIDSNRPLDDSQFLWLEESFADSTSDYKVISAHHGPGTHTPGRRVRKPDERKVGGIEGKTTGENEDLAHGYAQNFHAMLARLESKHNIKADVNIFAHEHFQCFINDDDSIYVCSGLAGATSSQSKYEHIPPGIEYLAYEANGVKYYGATRFTYTKEGIKVELLENSDKNPCKVHAEKFIPNKRQAIDRESTLAGTLEPDVQNAFSIPRGLFVAARVINFLTDLVDIFSKKDIDALEPFLTAQLTGDKVIHDPKEIIGEILSAFPKQDPFSAQTIAQVTHQVHQILYKHYDEKGMLISDLYEKLSCLHLATRMCENHLIDDFNAALKNKDTRIRLPRHTSQENEFLDSLSYRQYLTEYLWEQRKKQVQKIIEDHTLMIQFLPAKAIETLTDIKRNGDDRKIPELKLKFDDAITVGEMVIILLTERYNQIEALIQSGMQLVKPYSRIEELDELKAEIQKLEEITSSIEVLTDRAEAAVYDLQNITYNAEIRIQLRIAVIEYLEANAKYDSLTNEITGFSCQYWQLLGALLFFDFAAYELTEAHTKTGIYVALSELLSIILDSDLEALRLRTEFLAHYILERLFLAESVEKETLAEAPKSVLTAKELLRAKSGTELRKHFKPLAYAKDQGISLRKKDLQAIIDRDENAKEAIRSRALSLLPSPAERKKRTLEYNNIRFHRYNQRLESAIKAKEKQAMMAKEKERLQEEAIKELEEAERSNMSLTSQPVAREPGLLENALQARQEIIQHASQPDTHYFSATDSPAASVAIQPSSYSSDDYFSSHRDIDNLTDTIAIQPQSNHQKQPRKRRESGQSGSSHDSNSSLTDSLMDNQYNSSDSDEEYTPLRNSQR